ncbi:LINE-1 retrotransposable element ORF2 protein [Holothuria leucospilota]|uniref:LINE-1 retrotransposable element ORF2 protein n=1 Tax=Holothuria leucospilota TaxID=206669 RepID=A0A9Q1C628_HOLLE|nr:LINE-1 retrotransposable element ORF2 protein [Holothuria leucospilota]
MEGCDKCTEGAPRARSASLHAWGPGARARAPGGVQGKSPGGGPGGSAVLLDLRVLKEDRGPGFWKINNSLLTDPVYNTLIHDTVLRGTEDYRDYNPSLRWELIKLYIRNASISYSKKKARDRRRNELSLLKEISAYEHEFFLSNSPVILDKLKKARISLNELYEYKIEGIIVRSRARWVEQGEKSTAYFLNLEKRNKKYNVIQKLKAADGEEVAEGPQILKELGNFYEVLYTSEKCSPNLILRELQCDSKLTNDDAISCEGILTEEEYKSALNSLNNGKSPGSDGLSADFYIYSNERAFSK